MLQTHHKTITHMHTSNNEQNWSELQDDLHKVPGGAKTFGSTLGRVCEMTFKFDPETFSGDEQGDGTGKICGCAACHDWALTLGTDNRGREGEVGLYNMDFIRVQPALKRRSL